MIEIFNPSTATWRRLRNARITQDGPTGLYTLVIPHMPPGSHLSTLNGRQFRFDGVVSRQAFGTEYAGDLSGGTLTLTVSA